MSSALLVDFTFNQGLRHPYPVRIRVWVDGRKLMRQNDDGAPFVVGDTIRDFLSELRKWPATDAGQIVEQAAKKAERMGAYLDLRMATPDDFEDALQAERAFWDTVAALQQQESIAC